MKNIDTKISFSPVLNRVQKFGCFLENEEIVIQKRLAGR